MPCRFYSESNGILSIYRVTIGLDSNAIDIVDAIKICVGITVEITEQLVDQP
jgi:hypothetical protein